MSISSATSASAAAVSALQSSARPGQSSQVQRQHNHHPQAESPLDTTAPQAAQPTTTASAGSKVNTMA